MGDDLQPRESIQGIEVTSGFLCFWTYIIFYVNCISGAVLLTHKAYYTNLYFLFTGMTEVSTLDNIKDFWAISCLAGVYVRSL